jgi:hypothetical protein
MNPLKRREELRKQREDVTMTHDKLKDRVEEIAAVEDPPVRGGGSGRTEPRATRAALEAARVAVARGEPGAGAEVKRLAEREAEIEGELSDAFDAMHILARGKQAVEADIRKLHVDHFDVFAEAAEETVGEVLGLGEQIAELTARYVVAWRAAQLEWRDLAVDNDLAVVGRCPLVAAPSVRGVAPRPPGVRRDDEQAVAGPEAVAPGTAVTYHHVDGREMVAYAGTGHDDALRSDREWVAAA